MQVDVRVAQLLCSRLCHDLVSPIGAVNAGLELLEEAADDDGRALGLITTSAAEAARRLAFYRVAFGLGVGAQGAAPMQAALSTSTVQPFFSFTGPCGFASSFHWGIIFRIKNYE